METIIFLISYIKDISQLNLQIMEGNFFFLISTKTKNKNYDPLRVNRTKGVRTCTIIPNHLFPFMVENMVQ